MSKYFKKYSENSLSGISNFFLINFDNEEGILFVLLGNNFIVRKVKNVNLIVYDFRMQYFKGSAIKLVVQMYSMNIIAIGYENGTIQIVDIQKRFLIKTLNCIDLNNNIEKMYIFENNLTVLFKSNQNKQIFVKTYEENTFFISESNQKTYQNKSNNKADIIYSILLQQNQYCLINSDNQLCILASI